jgi:hypothetical protein
LPVIDGENPISINRSRATQPTGQIILADRGQIFFLFSFFCEYATSDFFQGQSISPRSIYQKISAPRNDSRHSIGQVIDAIGLNLTTNMGIIPQSGKNK